MAGQDIFNANSLVYTPQGASQSVSARADNFGNLGINNVFGKWHELARSGNLYVATSATASDAGIAGVVAPPSTTSGRILFNAAVKGSGVMVIPLRVSASLKSGTTGVGATLLVGLAGGALATPLTANGSAMTCKSTLDGLTTDSTTFTDINKTVVQPVYEYLAGHGQPATATAGIGTSLTYDLDGSIVIVPGNVMDVSVLAPTGSSPVFFISILYAKIKMDIGTPQ